MLSASSFTLSTSCPLRTFTHVSRKNQQPTLTDIFHVLHSANDAKFWTLAVSFQSMPSTLDCIDKDDERAQQKIKWDELGPNITEQQQFALSQLPPKMTKRCKALMKQIVCFSSEASKLTVLLNSWVKVMKPRRADWLVILKEMKRLDSPFLLEVMEYTLVEDSFEANVRDYTKIIDSYAKQNRLHDAENAFKAMKSRGFACDQVTLTVLVNMYSKAGNLNRAKEIFDEIRLLGEPLDKRSYGAMIMAYIRAEMPEHGEKLLFEMDSQETYACKEVYKALLRAYSIRGNTAGAQRVFDGIQFAGMVPDVKLCALLMNAYCVANQTDNARCVFDNMKHVGLKPSDKCVALMLAAYEREDEFQKAMFLLTELEVDGVMVGEEASEVLVRWFRRLGLEDELAQEIRSVSRIQERSIYIA